MVHFHTLKVSNINRETSDTVSVAFDVPSELKDEFRFIPGQYVTLKTDINGEDVRRSYSLCSYDAGGEGLRVAVKEVPGGKMSTFLNRELKEGTTLEVAQPEGSFTPTLNPEEGTSYLLFAAGSGITPMMSIIKGVLNEEPKSRITLFYGSRNESAVIFGKELDALVAKFEDRLQVVHIFSQPQQAKRGIFKKKPITTGRMDPKKVIALLNTYADMGVDNTCFICGPNGMMQAVQQALKTARIPEDQVHVEYFSAPDDGETPAESSSATSCTAEVVMDGESQLIEVEAGTTILDAALDAGLDAPYSCRGAVCSSCMAKLEEGSVDMKMNYVLTDAEVEEGYIVSCQSCPTTSKVKVNFDV